MPFHPQTLQYVVTACVIGLVLFIRFRRMRSARRLRLEWLWINPVLLMAVLAVSTWEFPPPTALGWLWLALAALAGAGLGWWRGTMMRITVDPATHALNQQSSPAALLFVVVLILARQGMRYEAAAHGINILKITGIMLAGATGAVTATRAEMFIRARRLLADARR